MDPEIVPGRTRGVTMGESSGKYYEGTFEGIFRYLRTKVPSRSILLKGPYILFEIGERPGKYACMDVERPGKVWGIVDTVRIPRLKYGTMV